MDCMVCVFCGRSDDKNEDLGQLCHSDTITVHQNCMYFSSGLCQNGDTDNQLLGFLETDIMAEVSRGRCHPKKCIVCSKRGFYIGCAIKKCQRAGHLPCIIKEGFLLQYYSNFKAYCPTHRPKQFYPPNTVLKNCAICFSDLTPPCSSVPPYCTKLPISLLLTPCCNNILHRTCIQAQARSAGDHYFRCPVCNNQTEFNQTMSYMGIEIPTRDASWESCDQFSDLHFPRVRCNLPSCTSIHGRNKHSKDDEVLDCVWCGQCIGHYHCIQNYHDDPNVAMAIETSPRQYICADCVPVYTRKRKCDVDQVTPIMVSKKPKIEMVIECGLPKCICIYGRSYYTSTGLYQYKYCYSCNRLLGHDECLQISRNNTCYNGHNGGINEQQYMCNQCKQLCRISIRKQANEHLTPLSVDQSNREWSIKAAKRIDFISWHPDDTGGDTPITPPSPPPSSQAVTPPSPLLSSLPATPPSPHLSSQPVTSSYPLLSSLPATPPSPPLSSQPVTHPYPLLSLLPATPPSLPISIPLELVQVNGVSQTIPSMATDPSSSCTVSSDPSSSCTVSSDPSSSCTVSSDPSSSCTVSSDPSSFSFTVSIPLKSVQLALYLRTSRDTPSLQLLLDPLSLKISIPLVLLKFNRVIKERSPAPNVASFINCSLCVNLNSKNIKDIKESVMNKRLVDRPKQQSSAPSLSIKEGKESLSNNRKSTLAQSSSLNILPCDSNTSKFDSSTNQSCSKTCQPSVSTSHSSSSTSQWPGSNTTQNFKWSGSNTSQTFKCPGSSTSRFLPIKNCRVVIKKL